MKSISSSDRAHLLHSTCTLHSPSATTPAVATTHAAMPSSPEDSLLCAAHALAASHHAQYDPSHDLHHIHRVLSLSLLIANSLPAPPDLLVVQLATLFHDLLDSKYLPPGAVSLTARERLEGFWLASGEGLSEERRRLVERVVENVSYSKEVKRTAKGEQTAWHDTCAELHW